MLGGGRGVPSLLMAISCFMQASGPVTQNILQISCTSEGILDVFILPVEDHGHSIKWGATWGGWGHSTI